MKPNNKEDSAELFAGLCAMIAHAEHIEWVPCGLHVNDVWRAEPLQLCTAEWFDGTGAIVKYRDDGEAQKAFNIVASALPEGVKLKPAMSDGGPQWTWLRPLNSDSDPLGQYGYIGWRVYTPFKVCLRMFDERGEVPA